MQIDFGMIGGSELQLRGSACLLYLLVSLGMFNFKFNIVPL